MKKPVLLVVSAVLFCSSVFATNFIDSGAYMDLEIFFRNFYEENFTKSDELRLCSNGYLASSLAIFDKKEDMSHLFVNQLISKKKLKQAIIESMLTVFAYAQPNEKEKRDFADLIYRKIVDKYDIYWIEASANIQAKTLLSLTSSCAGGPEKMLIIRAKEASVASQPAVYIVSSNVCD